MSRKGSASLGRSIETFLHDQREGGSLAPATVLNLDRDLRALIDLLGHSKSLDEISEECLRSAIATYAGRPDQRFASRESSDAKGRGDGAASRFVGSVRSFFRVAHERGWIADNPAADIAPRRYQKTPQASSALEDILSALRAPRPANPQRERQQLSRRDELIVLLLAHTGCSTGALCALDVTDIEFQTTHAALVFKQDQHGYSRTVRLPGSVSEAVRGHLADETTRPAGQTALFVTWRGHRMKPRDVQNLTTRIGAAMNAALTPQSLRNLAQTDRLRQLLTDARSDSAPFRHERVEWLSKFESSGPQGSDGASSRTYTS